MFVRAFFDFVDLAPKEIVFLAVGLVLITILITDRYVTRKGL